MSKNLTEQDLIDLSQQYKIDLAMLRAFIAVESSGRGFSNTTGKILIQFEPVYFSKLEPNAPKTIWYSNKIDVQSKEWGAFESACKYSVDSAIKSTSFGMLQVMGIHYRSLGFNTPKEMFEFAEYSEKNQVELGIRFIKSNRSLNDAISSLDFDKIAYYYNGSGYKKLAKKLGTKPYDEKLEFYYNKYKNENK